MQIWAELVGGWLSDYTAQFRIANYNVHLQVKD